MEALKINTILKKDGEIFIQNLPLDKTGLLNSHSPLERG